jgi:hypothetical protein
VFGLIIAGIVFLVMRFVKRDAPVGAAHHSL